MFCREYIFSRSTFHCHVRLAEGDMEMAGRSLCSVGIPYPFSKEQQDPTYLVLWWVDVLYYHGPLQNSPWKISKNLEAKAPPHLPICKHKKLDHFHFLPSNTSLLILQWLATHQRRHNKTLSFLRHAGNSNILTRWFQPI